jgi:hypothetical protein
MQTSNISPSDFASHLLDANSRAADVFTVMFLLIQLPKNVFSMVRFCFENAKRALYINFKRAWPIPLKDEEVAYLMGLNVDDVMVYAAVDGRIGKGRIGKGYTNL